MGFVAPTTGNSLQSEKNPAQPSVQAWRLTASDALLPGSRTKKRLPPRGGERREGTLIAGGERGVEVVENVKRLMNVADEMDQEAELRGLREKSGEVGTEISETSDWSISVKRDWRRFTMLLSGSSSFATVES